MIDEMLSTPEKLMLDLSVPGVSASVPRMSYYVASRDPFLSCTVVVPSSDDELLIEDEARYILVDSRAR